jgi:hypothetical protein
MPVASSMESTTPVVVVSRRRGAGHLYTGVSMKRDSQPSPLFRASIRDQFGDDFINQSDFGLGLLVVK